jgi:hypothetical protein
VAKRKDQCAIVRFKQRVSIAKFKAQTKDELLEQLKKDVKVLTLIYEFERDNHERNSYNLIAALLKPINDPGHICSSECLCRNL